MQIQENISLKSYNTFGLDVKAKYFASISSTAELQEAWNHIERVNGNTMILGGGSNVLFLSDFDGWVLQNRLSGIQITKEDGDYVYVKAAGGVVWNDLVQFCIKHNLAGIENLSLIPGSVGAAPMQNIGAYGVEQKDCFYELESYDLREKLFRTFQNADCRFSYRDSVFKNEEKGNQFICSVTYRLSKVPDFSVSYGAIQSELDRMGVKDLSIAAVSNAVCNIRRSKLPDPTKIGNAGSFFKNPVVSTTQFNKLKQVYENIVAYKQDSGDWKLAAGWLIESCGWKGKTLGNYGVHKDQALVLVNYGGAQGKQIYDLSEEILQSVKEKFDVELEREVQVIG